jgi:hypothetical protein
MKAKTEKKEVHNHGKAANTDDAFATFTGCTVQGHIHHNGHRTLIFKCGWGLTFNYNGSFWVENPEEVVTYITNAIEVVKKSGLEANRLLELMGAEWRMGAKFLLFIILLLAVPLGCGAKAADSAHDGDTVQPWPSDQEIVNDLWQRQHAAECRALKEKTFTARAKMADSGVPLDQVNGLTDDDRLLASKCGIKPQKISVYRAVGCFTDSGWIDGITLSGPGGRTYTIRTGYVNNNNMPAAPGLEWGHYYKVQYWRVDGEKQGYDHIFKSEDLGKCA